MGGKMANLGEIGNRIGLPVPQGFAVTAAAYKHFLDGLGHCRRPGGPALPGPHRRPGQPRDRSAGSCRPWCARRRCPRTWRPPSWQAAPNPAHPLAGGALQRGGRGHRVFLCRPVRHPAQRGRRRGCRSTTRRSWPASSPPGPFSIGNTSSSPSMNCPWRWASWPWCRPGPAASCSPLDPHAPESDTVLITAVWGLGKYAVDGTISPDLYEVSRKEGHALKQRRVTDKPVALVCRPDGGVAEMTLPAEAGPGALPHRRPGPDPGGNRSDAGGTFRRAPGHRMDRGGSRQYRHPAVPAPADQHPQFRRRRPGTVRRNPRSRRS